jgi:phosphoribosylglycinamide formyltransferase-1
VSHKNHKKVVLFASGAGSNVQKICEYFQNHEIIKVTHLYCNNSKARVLEKAKAFGIDYTLFNKAELLDNDKVLEKLLKTNPDLIVLAGFLLKIPKKITEKFSNKIINIHPPFFLDLEAKECTESTFTRLLLTKKKREQE